MVFNWLCCEFQFQIYVLTEEEFNQPFEDEYLESISKLSYEDLDDKYNPGIQVPFIFCWYLWFHKYLKK